MPMGGADFSFFSLFRLKMFHDEVELVRSPIGKGWESYGGPSSSAFKSVTLVLFWCPEWLLLLLLVLFFELPYLKIRMIEGFLEWGFLSGVFLLDLIYNRGFLNPWVV
jgi:hypothetical protein